MSNRIRPPIKIDEQGRVIRNPNVRAHRWRLNLPGSITGGRKQRLFFETERDAKLKRDELLENRQGIPARKIAELAKRGMTVEDAIDYTLEHAPVVVDMTFLELTERFELDRKQEVGVGARYAATLASYLKKIRQVFGPDKVAKVTKERVRTFLSGLKGPNGITAASADTRNHYLETLIAIFNYAKAERLLTHSPIEAVKKTKADDEDVAILTLEETTKLLGALARPEHAEVAPAALIQLFAAPRRSELMHISWDIVGDRYLRLDKVKRGTKKRPVELSAALLAGLEPFRKPEGYIFAPVDVSVDRDCKHIRDIQQRTKAIAKELLRLEDAYSARLERAAKAAGIRLPKNALRHTAITMRVNETGDIPGTARWAGNSKEVIEEDYLGIASPEDAEKFYALMPPPGRAA